MTKRLVDIIGALIGLVLFSAVMLAIALAIVLTMGRPILFRQIRPGKGGNPFQMVKFRTMKTTLDSEGNPLPDAVRITRLGHFLRSTSLDELPEFWNVLRGEMSLVGPRPLLMEYLPLYSPTQARRNDIRPGITGWAQVNGRNSLSWQDKFALDVWYVDHQTLSLDLRILILTLRKVIAREGIAGKGQATAEKFAGNG